MKISQPSESSTIRYYDDRADEYVEATVDVDMESLYQPFLELLPPAGMILDAGCGSGRDSKQFANKGYRVTAIDASASMVEAATRLIGQPVKQCRFQNLDAIEAFDGIWACASLVHVPIGELDGVLVNFTAALMPAGICYVSFREGIGERIEGGRLFTDFTESELRDRLKRQPLFDIVRLWTTTDLRPGRSERWVNGLVRKVCRI